MSIQNEQLMAALSHLSSAQNSLFKAVQVAPERHQEELERIYARLISIYSDSKKDYEKSSKTAEKP